ncbi:MAG: hypothetical protein H6550_10980 [Chitinophagales bacterium]|nr:hypothetical protein [Chitinophagales bacterium]
MTKPDNSVEFMYESIITIFDYIIDKKEREKAFHENNKELFIDSCKQIQAEHPKDYPKGLKQAYNDMTTMAQHLVEYDESEKEILDNMLIAKSGRGLIDAELEQEKTITKILRRKKIKNEEEYYIVTELLSDTSNNFRGKDKLSNILAEYEEKHSK